MFPSWNARAVGQTMSAEAAVELAAEAGFGGVDLLVRDLLEKGTDPHQLRRRMDELGLRGGAWSLPVRWRDDVAPFAADLDLLPRYARAAEILGLTVTGTWVLPNVRPASLSPDTSARDARSRTFALHLDRLGRIARILGDHGIRFGLEIMGPATARRDSDEAFIRTYAELVALMEELRREHTNVGVLADAFHLFAAGEEATAATGRGVGDVVWAHVADPVHADLPTLRDEERALPGESGLGVCRALLRLLKERGFNGPVTAEPLGACRALRGLSAAAVARRTREALASVWPEKPG